MTLAERHASIQEKMRLTGDNRAHVQQLEKCDKKSRDICKEMGRECQKPVETSSKCMSVWVLVSDDCLSLLSDRVLPHVWSRQAQTYSTGGTSIRMWLCRFIMKTPGHPSDTTTMDHCKGRQRCETAQMWYRYSAQMRCGACPTDSLVQLTGRMDLDFEAGPVVSRQSDGLNSTANGTTHSLLNEENATLHRIETALHLHQPE